MEYSFISGVTKFVGVSPAYCGGCDYQRVNFMGKAALGKS